MILRITSEIAVNTNEIEYILGMSTTFSKEYYREAAKSNTLIKLTRGKPCRSLIVLKSGKAIALEMRYDTLLKKWDITEKGSS